MLRSKSFMTACILLTVVFILAGSSQAMNYGEYTPDFDTAVLWHLNEGSGTIAYDSGLVGNDGTFVGTTPPTWSTGLFSGGIETTMYYNTSTTDGSCGILIPDDPMNFSNVTLEMYLKWEYASTGPIPGDTGFIGYLAGDFANNNFNFFVQCYLDDKELPGFFTCSLNYIWHLYGYPETQTASTDDTGYSLVADTWTHVAFTSNWHAEEPNVLTQKIYVDGEIVDVARSIGGGLWGYDTYIGQPVADPNVCAWGGEMDEIRISSITRYPPFGPNDCGGWGYLDGDINADCNVVFVDFTELAGNWATCAGLAGDIVDMGDGCIDLYDLDQFASDWLKCTTPGAPDCINCDSVVAGGFVEGTVGPNTLALWHLNEGSGTIAYDEVSGLEMTIDLNIYNEVTWTTGKFGNALNYADGGEGQSQSEHLGICNVGDDPVYELTIEQWLRVDPDADAQYATRLVLSFMSRMDSISQVAAGFYSYSDGGFGVWIVPTFTPNGPGAHIDDDWHHLASVYDGILDDNNDIHVYLYWDGVLAAQGSYRCTDPGYDPQLVTYGPGIVETGWPTWGSNWNGDIDEIRITTLAMDKFFAGPCD